MQHCQQSEAEAEFNYASHEQPMGYSSRRSGKSPKAPEIAVHESVFKAEASSATPVQTKDEAETNAETTAQASPDKDDFKKRLEAMMAKGRPPVKTVPQQQRATSWGPSQDDISKTKVDDMLAMPSLKKQRTITKKYDLDNFDF